MNDLILMEYAELKENLTMLAIHIQLLLDQIDEVEKNYCDSYRKAVDPLIHQYNELVEQKDLIEERLSVIIREEKR